MSCLSTLVSRRACNSSTLAAGTGPRGGGEVRTRSGSTIVDKLPYSSTLSYTVARPPVTCVSRIRGVQHLETISGFRGIRAAISCYRLYGAGPTRAGYQLNQVLQEILSRCCAGGYRGWIPHGTTRGRSRNWPRPSRPKRTRRCSRHWSGISRAIYVAINK